MFEPKGEIAQRLIAYQAIQRKAAGEVITYEELERVTGLDRQTLTGLRDEVAKLFNREQNRHVVCVRAVGWKVISGIEQVEAVARRRRQLTKRAGRNVQIMDAVDYREMSGPQRLRADAERINNNTLYGVGLGLARKKLSLDDVVAWQQERAA